MPRWKLIKKSRVQPDPKFKSKMVARFINCIMKDGKKSLAESILYRALDIIQDKTQEDPLVVFQQAMSNAKPVLEVKSRRVGGSTYQIPVEVRPDRRVALAMRWLIDFARKRSENSMDERLAAELLDAYNKRGSTIKKKEDTHKMADANKAFAHYRW